MRLELAVIPREGKPDPSRTRVPARSIAHPTLEADDVAGTIVWLLSLHTLPCTLSATTEWRRTTETGTNAINVTIAECKRKERRLGGTEAAGGTD